MVFRGVKNIFIRKIGRGNGHQRLEEPRTRCSIQKNEKGKQDTLIFSQPKAASTLDHIDFFFKETRIMDCEKHISSPLLLFS